MTDVRRAFGWIAAALALAQVAAAGVSDAWDLATVSEQANRAAFWQLAHPVTTGRFVHQHTPLYWTMGAFYNGLLDWGLSEWGDEGLVEHVRRTGVENGWSRQVLERDVLGDADTHCVCAAWLQLAAEDNVATGRHESAKACFDALLADPTVYPMEFVRSDRLTRMRWTWADALYMSPPAWTLLGGFTGGRTYLDHMAKEFRATTEKLFDRTAGLYRRDSTYLPGGCNWKGKDVFWSRGNGWAFAAFAMILRDLPPDHPSRDWFVSTYRRMAEGIASRQQADGSWHPDLADPGAPDCPEMSGTCFFAYGYLWGLNNGLIGPEPYESVVRRAWSAVCRAMSEDGRLGWVQQVGSAPTAELQADYFEYYATGAYLSAAKELVGWLTRKSAPAVRSHVETNPEARYVPGYAVRIPDVPRSARIWDVRYARTVPWCADGSGGGVFSVNMLAGQRREFLILPATSEPGRRTPETSRLFRRYTNPDTGVVSYLMKDGVSGFWNQQSLYFTAKSMTDDGRFLVLHVSDDERTHPVTNYIDCAQTKSIVDFASDEVILLEGTDGGIPFLDTKTGKLYYVRRDKTTVNAFYARQGMPVGECLPAVFMRDLYADPRREIRLCSIPDAVKCGGTNVFMYCTHLTLTRDRRKAYLETTTDVDFAKWRGIGHFGLLDLETGGLESWGRCERYVNHGQLNPQDDALALNAFDGCWTYWRTGETFPRLQLTGPAGFRRMVAPAFRNYATHENWNARGTSFVYCAYTGVEYELASGWSRVACPLRCWHPAMDSTDRYVLIDNPHDTLWRGCPWRIGVWDRQTGRKVDIFTGHELAPKNPKRLRSSLHPDAHPQFVCNDRYIVSTYNTARRSMTVCVTPTEQLRRRLASETDESDVWDLAETAQCADSFAQAPNTCEEIEGAKKLRELILMRSGVPMRGSGRVFAIGCPPGARPAEPGEGCVRVIGGALYLWGECSKAVELLAHRLPKGRKVVLRDGTFWTTRHPDSTTLIIAGGSGLEDYDGRHPHWRGWAAFLAMGLKDGVFAVDFARSGASTADFRRRGYWVQLVSTIRPQDHVLVQFGSDEADGEVYRENLCRFVSDVRSKGGVPVFATPLGTGPSVARCRKTMQEVSCAFGVELVDVGEQPLSGTHLDPVAAKDVATRFRRAVSGRSGGIVKLLGKGK